MKVNVQVQKEHDAKNEKIDKEVHLSVTKRGGCLHGRNKRFFQNWTTITTATTSYVCYIVTKYVMVNDMDVTMNNAVNSFIRNETA